MTVEFKISASTSAPSANTLPPAVVSPGDSNRVAPCTRAASRPIGKTATETRGRGGRQRLRDARADGDHQSNGWNESEERQVRLIVGHIKAKP